MICPSPNRKLLKVVFACSDVKNFRENFFKAADVMFYSAGPAPDVPFIYLHYYQ